jgi:hypothetical protein
MKQGRQALTNGDHLKYHRASVQLSENARAQVLNGLPSRWFGNARPLA